MTKPHDCVLFIDDAMARLVVMWGRMPEPDNGDGIEIPAINARYSPEYLAAMLGGTRHQVKAMVDKAVAVGIFEEGGAVSGMAQKCVNAIIAKKIQELKE